jgi:hypothetical protein
VPRHIAGARDKWTVERRQVLDPGQLGDLYAGSCFSFSAQDLAVSRLPEVAW